MEFVDVSLNENIINDLGGHSEENSLEQVIAPVLAPPPKLNPEIKVVAKDTAGTRDTSLESQTRAALTATGKCLTELIKSEHETVEGRSNLDFIEALSDFARLIADLHYKQSTARQNLVSMNLDQSLKDVIEDTSLDDFCSVIIQQNALKQTRLLKGWKELR
ncbi:hypothetical protein JTB14_009682 [Gonioctena quinquepunctata]|nr:hypothetical protein JTB14_009682 [Gonioctena quinquepunctata]